MFTIKDLRAGEELTFDYQFPSNTKLQITANALFGERNSVQLIASPLIMDTINAATLHYNPRQVDRDYYSGFTTEARLLHSYEIGKIKSTLSGGLRYSTEMTKRKQKGEGTTGSNFDLSIDKPYGIDLRFTTHNYAAFLENIFQLTERFSITPGVRYEVINSDLKGKINNATDAVAYKGHRDFPLFGAGLQYQVNKISQLYGNISQAYRPYMYANITPADRVDVIDPNLKDSKGYDIDLGYRGHYKDVLNFDANAFYLFYGDRVGLLTQKNADNSSYLFTTNVGDAVTKGAEVYVELSLLKSLTKTRDLNDIRIFNSLAYYHSRYTSGEAIKASVNTSLKGNHVENVPDWMNKTGVTFQHKQITTMFQFSYTSMSYNDALNTSSSANGITGIIPAYHVWDWSINWELSKPVHVSAGINNFTDEKYFSRRITFYPGPGILPADGRTFYISLGLKL